MRRFGITTFVILVFAVSATAQVNEICGETGDVPWLNSPFVFGKIRMNGFDMNDLPKITVVLYETSMRDHRYTIDRSGNFCFRRINASGGILAVEIETVEVARKSLPSGGRPGPIREDFDIYPTHPPKVKPPSAISAKFVYPRDDRNQALFRNAVEAERIQDHRKAVEALKTIVGSDPADYIAWAKICEINYSENKIPDARANCIRSIQARADYPPAIVNLGQILLVQNQPAEAVKFLELATRLEPTYARAFQLLGEAYVLTKNSSSAITALTEAIRLDPDGMGQSHLLLAVIYDAKGDKPRAAEEYKEFLKKSPKHRDRGKFERYIKENGKADKT